MWKHLMLTICSVFVLTGSALTGDLSRVPDKDFNTLEAAGNEFPEGIWSDGTTMWVLDSGGDKIYAYNKGSKARDPGKDFNELDATNNFPEDIWSDGTTMWVVDSYYKKIYAYNMRSKARDPGKDFELHIASTGIWSDGTTMWVLASAKDKIYAYDMRSRARDPDKDLELHFSAYARDTDIWLDGATMWVVDDWDDTMYAYDMRSRARDPKDFHKLTGIYSPTGIWSDGTTVWVVDGHYDKIYAYGGLAVISEQGRWSDQAIQNFSMKIKGSTGSLKICVRDHECEDGDRIRVEVDGRRIFSGEIDNDWDCYTLNVWAGESYAVELTALNGTGYKGDCSYRDENTGEIRVTGENTETQVWRHRGGAGSKARIIVETVR